MHWTTANTSQLQSLKVAELQKLAVDAITWHAQHKKIQVQYVTDIPSRKRDLIEFLDEARASYWNAVHGASKAPAHRRNDRAGIPAREVNAFLKQLPRLDPTGEVAS